MSAEDELYSSVVFNDMSTARRLLEGGADPNYIKSDGANPTLLHMAIWSGIEMVDLFLHHGADPLQANTYGERPFHTALQDEKYADIASRLREFEPAKFHDLSENEKLAKRFNAPESLILRLSGDDLSLGQTDNGTPLVRLLPLADVYVFKFLEREYLVLSCTILEQEHGDFYFCGPIVWCGTQRKVCGIDAEHDTTCVVSDWDTFVSDTCSVVCTATYDDDAWGFLQGQRALWRK
jgi:hypothetical protein